MRSVLGRRGGAGPGGRGAADHGARHVLVIVQNLPVPLDRRVWLECQALRANGYDVSVICPKGPGDPSYEEIDGVHIFKYRPAPPARGLAGFALEFAYSWVRTAVLSLRVARQRRFDVIQACNPPDTYWLLALLWRSARVRFVFDQHDLNPELFLSRFGEPTTLLRRAEFATLGWLERMTYRWSHRVISTNESYRGIALTRGRRRPGDVTVVRSGPDTRTMRPVYPPAPRPEDGVELVYLGIMGPQDGVDNVLLVVDELVHRRGRSGVHATLMGFGDSYDELVGLAARLGLGDHVTFTGRAGKRMVAENLSRADIGLSPDLKTPLNDVSTMNKTMEYMAFALPSVSFDLVETRVSGGETVLFVESGNIAAFADAVERLIDDDALRLRLARLARGRVVESLDWRPQADAYVRVYDSLLGVERPDGVIHPGIEVGEADEWGNVYVPLEDEAEFERYILSRRTPLG